MSETPLLEKLQTELLHNPTPNGSENDLSSNSNVSTEHLSNTSGESDNRTINSESLSGSNGRLSSCAGSKCLALPMVMSAGMFERKDNNTETMVQRLHNALQPKRVNKPLKSPNISLQQYLNQLPKDLTNVDHEVLRQLLDLPPPPEYPRINERKQESQLSQLKKSIARLERYQAQGSLPQSLSQPELRHFHINDDDNDDHLLHGSSQEKFAQPSSGCPVVSSSQEDCEYESIASRAIKMVEILSEENCQLRSELETYYNKISKLQSVEIEIQKIYQAHDSLCKSSEKRERLEKSARIKLEAEVRNLRQHNSEMREQLEAATSQLSRKGVGRLPDSEVRKELNRRDVMISQLLTQTKELQDTKERQLIELSAQQATLSEQRAHIDILDSALTNAQASVVKLEGECRKKQVYVDRVDQLQKALMSLQETSKRREENEKKLRQRLETQLEELRTGKERRLVEAKDGESPAIVMEMEMNELKQQLIDKDERLIQLEGEVGKWEQLYLEESAIRQIALDAAAMPKDAKIAALEKTSEESEKLIAEAHHEKMKHMDEIYTLNKRAAESDSRLQIYQTQLAEKDAMIRVLQKHAADKDYMQLLSASTSFSHTPMRSTSSTCSLQQQQDPLSSPATSYIRTRQYSLDLQGALASSGGGNSSDASSSTLFNSSTSGSSGTNTASSSFVSDPPPQQAMGSQQLADSGTEQQPISSQTWKV